MEDNKKKVGRPAFENSKQLEEKGIFPKDWKQGLINLGKEGKAQTHFMVYLNISKNTYYKIIQIDPEFRDIVAQARDQSKLWWFEIAREGFDKSQSKTINGQLFSLMIRNLFPDDYVDKKEVDIQTLGQPIKDNKIQIEIIKKIISDDDENK